MIRKQIWVGCVGLSILVAAGQVVAQDSTEVMQKTEESPKTSFWDRWSTGVNTGIGSRLYWGGWICEPPNLGVFPFFSGNIKYVKN